MKPLELLLLIDKTYTAQKDWEELQNKLVAQLGDAGNDIGDAGDAGELIGNQITERNEEDRGQFITLLAKILKLPVSQVKKPITEMEEMKDEDYNKLMLEYSNSPLT